jgi:hypothetical protein
MTKKIIVLLLLSVTLTNISCSYQRKLERPEGLPELYPCSISVTFGGNAIEGVKVSLTPVDGDMKWKPSGLTDKNGTAKLDTSYGFEGVPVGLYTISFSKIIHTADDSDPSIPENKSLIPLKYKQGNFSEKIEIKAEEKNEFSFVLDAGEEFVPQKKKR